MQRLTRAALALPWAVLFLFGLCTLARGEFRTWTSAQGGFKTEAEFIDLRDGKVRLRLKTGGEREVPLDRLSADDQDFVRLLTAKPATGKSERVLKLEQDSERCRTAEEALRLYRVFRDDPKTTNDERLAILDRFEELKRLAADKMVRCGGKWITEAELKERRQQANTLMKQGLELLRLNQEEGFRKRFAEAAELEPESVRAEFLMGLIYCQAKRDLNRAEQYFESCVKRDPNNIAVLNNLALIELKRGHIGDSLGHWEAAMKIEPHQFMVHNLGRLVTIAGKRQLALNKSLLAEVSDLYVSQLGKNKFGPTNEALGWLFMLIDNQALDLDLEDGEKKAPAPEVAPPPDNEGLHVVGSGSGFVVAPGYILTNNHVAEAGVAYDIQTEALMGRTLRATLVGRSEKPDLALLKCDELDAPVVPIDAAVAKRGSDIMILGFPKTSLLGATLKATRGVISALPNSAVEDMYLYDAVVNPGNSGGPVFDQHGNVVAVETIGIMTEGKYGGGIPGAAALAFIKKHLPGFVAQPLRDKVLEWPEVDEKCGPATVLVWIRQKANAHGPVAAPGKDYVEDITCTVCGNRQTPNPKCPICAGTGIDMELIKHKADLIAAEAKAAQDANPSPPPAGRRPTPSTAAQPAANVKDDTNKTFAHPPLDPQLIAKLRTAMSGNRTLETAVLGMGKVPFREVPAKGALLIGFDFAFGESAGHLTVAAVRPHYLSSQGKTFGSWYGSTPKGSTRHVEARPGYAVAGMKMHTGIDIDAISVVFMRVGADALDVTDSYESPMYGSNQETGRPRSVGLDGTFVIGIHGKAPSSANSRSNGLGLVTVGQ